MTLDEEMESKWEQYSKGSKENRGKDSEQTITSAKEKKEVSFEEL